MDAVNAGSFRYVCSAARHFTSLLALCWSLWSLCECICIANTCYIPSLFLSISSSLSFTVFLRLFTHLFLSIHLFLSWWKETRVGRQWGRRSTTCKSYHCRLPYIDFTRTLAGMLCCNIGMGELAWNCLIVVFRVTRRCYYVGKSSMTFKREGIFSSKTEIESFRKIGILMLVEGQSFTILSGNTYSVLFIRSCA